MGEPGDERLYAAQEGEDWDPNWINPGPDWDTAVADRNTARKMMVQRIDILLMSLGIIDTPAQYRKQIARLNLGGGVAPAAADNGALIKAIAQNTRAVAALVTELRAAREAQEKYFDEFRMDAKAVDPGPHPAAREPEPAGV